MSFRTVGSLTDLTHRAKLTSKITQEITKEIFIKTSNFSIFFSLFLANSKGKDKFIALFQYLFEFICMCGKHSNIPTYADAYKRSTTVVTQRHLWIWLYITTSRKIFPPQGKSFVSSGSSTR